MRVYPLIRIAKQTQLFMGKSYKRTMNLLAYKISAGVKTRISNIAYQVIKYKHRSRHLIADLAKLRAWEIGGDCLYAYFPVWDGEHFCFTLLDPIVTGLRAFSASHSADPGCPKPLLVGWVLECPHE